MKTGTRAHFWGLTAIRTQTHRSVYWALPTAPTMPPKKKEVSLSSSEKAAAKKIKAKENVAKANPELAAKNKASGACFGCAAGLGGACLCVWFGFCAPVCPNPAPLSIPST